MQLNKRSRSGRRRIRMQRLILVSMGTDYPSSDRDAVIAEITRLVQEKYTEEADKENVYDDKNAEVTEELEKLATANQELTQAIAEHKTAEENFRAALKTQNDFIEQLKD